MKRYPVLILGGGLTGLTLGYHLKKSGIPFLIIEKEAVPGGMCRSRTRNGYTFDYTGHLLHCRQPEVLAFVQTMLEGNLIPLHRKSLIHLYGIYTAYPFQFNLKGYSEEVISECLEGLKNRGPAGNGNTRDWALATFGAGICKHFFFPYNEKFWKYSLEDISSEWTGSFVPKPTVEDVVARLSKPGDEVGYNADFLYPRSGGIGSLVSAIAKDIEEAIWLEQPVKTIDVEHKKVGLQEGEELRYDFLVNTIPLNTFLKLARPAELPGLPRLEGINLVNVNVGIKGEFPDAHWVYLPEGKFRSHRIGCYTHFSPAMSPVGRKGLYLETSLRKGEDIRSVERAALADLRTLHSIEGEHQVEELEVNLMENAYVIYKMGQSEEIHRFKNGLREKGVLLAGRYGNWEYSSMGDNMHEAMVLANSLKEGLK